MQSAGEEAPLQVSAPAMSTAAATGASGEPASENGGKSPASPSMDNERQIPVDPVSLRHLGMVADPDSPLSAPSVFTELVAHSSPLLPPLRRPTFVGASLPCSASSSPVHSATAKRPEEPSLATVTAMRSLARQHSAALAHYVTSPSVAPTGLSRNASRAEGRSMAPHDDEYPHHDERDPEGEPSFKCGVLCMFIPGFNKKKPGSPSAAAVVSSIQRQQSGARRRSSVSRMASMERFECGSWSPPPPHASASVVELPHVDTDFAMEVAKISCVDDTDMPIKMAFVFEGEARGVLKKSASESRLPESAAPVKMAFVFDGEPKGILKKSASALQRQESASRMSSASQRHVRFSTAAPPPASCPTSPSITPRLAMARAEFNAFLEAQSA